MPKRSENNIIKIEQGDDCLNKSLLCGTQYIIQIREHFEAYHSTGEFICSGDTFKECSDEVVELIKAEIYSLKLVSG